jgi:S-adenosylmethionine decarboxylase
MTAKRFASHSDTQESVDEAARHDVCSTTPDETPSAARQVMPVRAAPIATVTGLHLIGDLHRCRRVTPYMTDRAVLREHCLALVAECGLTVIGDSFHQFGGSGGVTGVVVLAESHLALHTWPERMSVTLDVYVCNYGENNRDKARRLFEALLVTFCPEEPHLWNIDRV